MPTPEERQAAATADATLATIEMTNTFADLAASFRDALLSKNFGEAPAEMAGLQMASAIFPQLMGR